MLLRIVERGARGEAAGAGRCWARCPSGDLRAGGGVGAVVVVIVIAVAAVAAAVG